MTVSLLVIMQFTRVSHFGLFQEGFLKRRIGPSEIYRFLSLVRDSALSTRETAYLFVTRFAADSPMEKCIFSTGASPQKQWYSKENFMLPTKLQNGPLNVYGTSVIKIDLYVTKKHL